MSPLRFRSDTRERVQSSTPPRDTAGPAPSRTRRRARAHRIHSPEGPARASRTRFTTQPAKGKKEQRSRRKRTKRRSGFILTAYLKYVFETPKSKEVTEDNLSFILLPHFLDVWFENIPSYNAIIRAFAFTLRCTQMPQTNQSSTCCLTHSDLKHRPSVLCKYWFYDEQIKPVMPVTHAYTPGALGLPVITVHWKHITPRARLLHGAHKTHLTADDNSVWLSSHLSIPSWWSETGDAKISGIPSSTANKRCSLSRRHSTSLFLGKLRSYQAIEVHSCPLDCTKSKCRNRRLGFTEDDPFSGKKTGKNPPSTGKLNAYAVEKR